MIRRGHELEGPCPSCGGRDRFSINLSKNVWNCRQCQAGGGDAISLVQHVFGIDFLHAVGWLTGEDRPTPVDPEKMERMRRENAEKQARQDAIAEREREQAIRHAAKIWTRTRTPVGSIVVGYYEHRNLGCLPDPMQVRFSPDEPYRIDLGTRQAPDWQTIHSGPCMVARIARPDDTGGGVHRTWIDLSRRNGQAEIIHPKTGEVLKSKLTRGSKKGGAIRLYTPPDPVALIGGEGIETTETARGHHFRHDAAYWAFVDRGNMAGRTLSRDRPDEPDPTDSDAFLPPDWCRELIYLGDDGPEHKVTRNALVRGLKRARAHCPTMATKIVWAGEGVDMNDLVMPGECTAGVG